jgi:serine/threonine protein kinase
MYRLQFSMFYTEAEQLYIANQILSKYKTLLDNNITHRDIRPSKIYLSSSPLQSKPSSAPPLGYELLNL